MEVNMLSIGKRIRLRRIELYLTQTDIHESCGIASGVLSRIENGKNVPSILAFYKLSQVLSCDVNWLVTGVSSNIQNFVLSIQEEKMITDFRELYREDQDELLEILKLKIQKRKRKEKINAKLPELTDHSNIVV